VKVARRTKVKKFAGYTNGDGYRKDDAPAKWPFGAVKAKAWINNRPPVLAAKKKQVVKK
jgi:hypothetical protein